MVLVFFFKNVVFRRGITPCAFFKPSKQFHFVKKELKLLWKSNLKARICDSLKLRLVDLLKPAPNSMILCGSIAFHSSLYRLNKSPKASAPSRKSFSPIRRARLSAPLPFCITNWGSWFHFFLRKLTISYTLFYLKRNKKFEKKERLKNKILLLVNLLTKVSVS